MVDDSVVHHDTSVVDASLSWKRVYTLAFYLHNFLNTH